MDPITLLLTLLGVGGTAAGTAVKAGAAGGGGGGSSAPFNEQSGQASYRNPEQRKAQAETADKAMQDWVNGVDPNGQVATDNMVLLTGDDAASLGYPRDNKGTLISRAELAQRLGKLQEDAASGVVNRIGPEGWTAGDAWNHWKTTQVGADFARLNGAQATAHHVSFEEEVMDKALGEQGAENEYGNSLIGRKAPNIDTTRFDQEVAAARGRRLEDADGSWAAMKGLANGQGPAVAAAQAQLQGGIDASNNQAMSMAASARGGVGAHSLAGRTAMMQGALNNQVGANAAAKLRADLAVKGIEGLAQRAKDDLGFDQFVAGQRGNFAEGDATNFLTNQRDTDTAVNNSKNRAKGWVDTGIGQVQQGASNTRDSADVGTRRSSGNAANATNHYGMVSNVVDSATGGLGGTANALGLDRNGNYQPPTTDLDDMPVSPSGIIRDDPYGGGENTGSSSSGLTSQDPGIASTTPNRKVKNGQIGFGGLF